MIKVIFKHWVTGEVLEVVGTLPPELNNNFNDRLVILKEDGTYLYEDIIKETIVRIETPYPSS